MDKRLSCSKRACLVSRIAAAALLALALVGLGGTVQADDNGGRVWVTSWTGSAQGPYPSGAAVAQPDLSFAFPTNSANDQTFRLIVHPSLLTRMMRIRFTNVFGSQPITFDNIYVGLQKSGATLVEGTNQRIHFNNGIDTLTLPAGQSAWSDPVVLPFANDDS